MFTNSLKAKSLLIAAVISLAAPMAHAEVATLDYDYVGPVQTTCTSGAVFAYHIHAVFHSDVNGWRGTWIYHGVDTATGDYIFNGILGDKMLWESMPETYTVKCDFTVIGKGDLPDFHIHIEQNVSKDGTLSEPHFDTSCE